MKKQSSLIIFFILLFIQNVGFAAENIYASSGFIISGFVERYNLFTINESTGSAEKIGPIGLEVTDIAFYGAELYGVTFSTFVKIDKTTGLGTEVGSLNFNNMNALAVSSRGEIYSADFVSGNLIKISIDTGNGTLIGNYGNGLTSSGDLAFDLNGALYATVTKPGSLTDWLAQVNTLTGEATLIGDVGFRGVYGLSFLNKVLYGVTFDGKFIKIDKLSGESVEFSDSNSIYGGLTTSAKDCSEISGTGIVSSSLDLYLPSLNYDSSQEILNIWVDFEYLGIGSDEQLLWGLKDFGVNQLNCSEISGTGIVSSSLDIHMPALTYEGLNIWADLEYVGKNSEEQHVWRLKDYGNN